MVTPWITAAETAYPYSDYAQTAVDYATFVLYKLTAEKYPGVQTTTEAYVAESRGSSLADPVSREAMRNIQMIGVPSTIQYPQRLYLRGAPVHEVLSVDYGGTLLEAGKDYLLYNKRFLKLANGTLWNYACGPTGITVTYTYGMMPPKAGVLAATTLANELLILMGEGGNPNQCRIPERVRSVSREGLSFDMIDPQDFMDDGRTGIWEIDLFIRTANPSRAKKQPRLLSASDPRRYRS